MIAHLHFLSVQKTLSGHLLSSHVPRGWGAHIAWTLCPNPSWWVPGAHGALIRSIRAAPFPKIPDKKQRDGNGERSSLTAVSPCEASRVAPEADGLRGRIPAGLWVPENQRKPVRIQEGLRPMKREDHRECQKEMSTEGLRQVCYASARLTLVHHHPRCFCEAVFR